MAIKEKVLEMLEANKGRSISGNKIAASLDVTRSAVWKTVNQLREEGFSISAGTNRGYCLTSDNDMLSEHAISAELKTRELGRAIDLFKTINSTNTFAKSLAQLGAVHGHTVISELQTEGRGRLGRSFHSPGAQGVYMSVIIRPQIPIDQALGLTACAAVAVCEAIDELVRSSSTYSEESKIKWVNDIFIGGRKVCGILTEASVALEQGGLDYVVLGFGVNVNNYSFPEELASVATSLRMVCGESFSRSKLAALILNHLERRIDTMGDGSFMNEYRRRSILTGRVIDVENNGAVERFECVGIDDSGKLIVRRGNGVQLLLSSGTVTIRN